MIIDIKNIKTYVIGDVSNSAKIDKVVKEIEKHVDAEISVFPAIMRTPGRTGLAMSFKKLFSKARDVPGPILFCEDDVVSNPNFNLDLIEVPDNADALYVGISKSGHDLKINPYGDPKAKAYSSHRDFIQNGLVVKKINEDIYRIYNMHSAHAIIIINKDYMKFLESSIDIAILSGGHQDIVRAVTMPFWNIYALNIPMFFQEGHHEEITNFEIAKLSDSEVTENLALL